MQIFCHSLAEVETCQVTMQNQHTPTHVLEKIHKAGHSKPGNSSSFVGSPLVLFSTRTFHAFVYILLFFFCSVQVCATIFHAHGHKKATTAWLQLLLLILLPTMSQGKSPVYPVALSFPALPCPNPSFSTTLSPECGQWQAANQSVEQTGALQLFICCSPPQEAGIFSITRSFITGIPYSRLSVCTFLPPFFLFLCYPFWQDRGFPLSSCGQRSPPFEMLAHRTN